MRQKISGSVAKPIARWSAKVRHESRNGYRIVDQQGVQEKGAN